MNRLLRLWELLKVPLIVALLGLLVVVSLVRLVGPPSTESIASVSSSAITVGERAQGTYQVGGHTVLIAGDGLTISHPRSPAFVWASPRDRAFLVASRGDPVTVEREGMVSVAVQVEESFNAQTVDGADIDSDGRLVVSGTLHEEETGEEIAYQMFLSVRPVRGPQMQMSVRVLGDVDRLSLLSEIEPNEQVYGLGEQFADFDLRGRVYPIIPREQGVGRGREPLSFTVDLLSGTAGSRATTYAPLPHYVTSAPRSLWVRSPGIVTVDLRGSGRTAVTIWGPAMDLTLGVGATPVAHVMAHATATGLMSAPPDWMGDGLMAGLGGGAETVRSSLQTLLDAGVSVSAVVVEDWAGTRRAAGWNTGVDTTLYPDWPAMVADLAADDIRVLTIVSPALSPESIGPVDRDLYAEADASGYLVLDEEGQPYLTDQGRFDAALVDLTNPEAWDWFVDVLVDTVLEDGVAGFLAEGGEGPPLDSVTVDGSGRQVRARFPDLWAAATQEALGRAGLAEDGIAVHRAAGTATAADVTMFSTGDQLTDFSDTDGLASVLDGLLSGGISGMALNHFDIGGFTNFIMPGPLPDIVRSAELAQRSAELAAFTPAMRTTLGGNPDHGAQATDADVAAHLADMVDLFVALGPERRRLTFEMTVEGLPLVRHPVLVVPEQPEVTGQPDVFFLGGDLLVAPVLASGVTRRQVTLPAGSWEEVWTGDRIDVERNAIGERIVDAPIGRPPAWARVGSQVAADIQQWRDR